MDVLVDENFRSLARNTGIKFTVFNDLVDNIETNEVRTFSHSTHYQISLNNVDDQDEYNEEDIVGSGQMSLKNLVDGDVVYPTVKIIGKTTRNKIEERGQIHVLVYWYEGWG